MRVHYRGSYFTLTSDEAEFTLSVTLDEAETKEYHHRLNSGEIYRFESQGAPFLEILAREIKENPDGFGKIAE